MKSSPAASNLLNQLWGCFLANFCLDTSTSLATAWPEAIYVHLMLTGAAGLSCWWNIVILFLITVCSMWDSPGLRETIRDLGVCVHRVANKENRPAPWKKTPVQYSQQKSEHTNEGFLPHHTPDVIRYDVNRGETAQTCSKWESLHASFSLRSQTTNQGPCLHVWNCGWWGWRGGGGP